VDEGGERRLVVIMCKKVEGCAEEIVVNMFSTKEGDGVSGRENCPTLVGSIIGLYSEQHIYYFLAEVDSLHVQRNVLVEMMCQAKIG
jgi:hypothetical protein